MQSLSRSLAVCLALAACSVAQIQPVVSGPDGKGDVDWSERYLVVTGIGAPNPDLPESKRLNQKSAPLSVPSQFLGHREMQSHSLLSSRNFSGTWGSRIGGFPRAIRKVSFLQG